MASFSLFVKKAVTKTKNCMAQRHLFSGLDIGSNLIRIVVAEALPGEEQWRILGVGTAQSVGVRRGAIIDVESVAKAVGLAVEQAETMAGVPINQVFVNVNGSDVFSQDSKGVVAIGKSDGEVVEDDIDRVLKAAEQQTVLPMNRSVLHILPRGYRLDDQKNIKDPLGMHGVRLEVDALVLCVSAQHLKNISRVLELVGLTAVGFVADPLATSAAVLSAKQKELGVAVVNVGNSVTTLAVFEEGDILHTKVFPIGAGHITNDIAIGLRTSIDIAESIKKQYGQSNPQSVNRNDEIDLSEFDSQEEDSVSTYHVAEIIEARMEEIFKFVYEELRSIGRASLLPSGVVLVGGGVKLPGTVELAKRSLRLPVHIGYPQSFSGILDQVDDPSFASVTGVIVQSEAVSALGRSNGWGSGFGLGELWEKMRRWMVKFLP